MIMHSRLKENLQQNKVSIRSSLHLNKPSAAEILGRSCFEWLILGVGLVLHPAMFFNGLVNSKSADISLFGKDEKPMWI